MPGHSPLLQLQQQQTTTQDFVTMATTTTSATGDVAGTSEMYERVEGNHEDAEVVSSVPTTSIEADEIQKYETFMVGLPLPLPLPHTHSTPASLPQHYLSPEI